MREDKEALQALAENGHSPMKREQVNFQDDIDNDKDVDDDDEDVDDDDEGIDDDDEDVEDDDEDVDDLSGDVKLLLLGSEACKQDPGGEVPRVFRSHTKGPQAGQHLHHHQLLILS